MTPSTGEAERFELPASMQPKKWRRPGDPQVWDTKHMHGALTWACATPLFMCQDVYLWVGMCVNSNGFVGWF